MKLSGWIRPLCMVLLCVGETDQNEISNALIFRTIQILFVYKRGLYFPQCKGWKWTHLYWIAVLHRQNRFAISTNTQTRDRCKKKFQLIYTMRIVLTSLFFNEHFTYRMKIISFMKLSGVNNKFLTELILNSEYIGR